MKLLVWDTSSKEGAIAALEWVDQAREGWSGVKLVSEWSLNVDLTHSDRLLWGIHQVLESSRWKLGEVDLFGVGMGPGSFTGLRIGVTTARTLASTLKKPLIGVSSLAALARPAANWLSSQKERAVVIACTDACKGELFALYGAARSITDCAVPATGDFAGLWKRGVEENVSTPDELMRGIKRKMSEGGGKSKWLALGEGRSRYESAWKTLPRAREVISPASFSSQIQGRFVGQLAWEAFQAGLARKALEIHPRYLRASDAEIKLKAGLLGKRQV
jgi:tRNA threonylcarbamoyladenosine biosynthesis protein TsaB